MSLYKKIIDEAIECSPMEKELAKQLDKMQAQLDTHQNIIKALSGISTFQVKA